jgi:hypothetical protein
MAVGWTEAKRTLPPLFESAQEMTVCDVDGGCPQSLLSSPPMALVIMGILMVKKVKEKGPLGSSYFF